MDTSWPVWWSGMTGFKLVFMNFYFWFFQAKLLEWGDSHIIVVVVLVTFRD